MDSMITYYSFFLGALVSLVPLLRAGAFFGRHARPWVILLWHWARYSLLIRRRRFWMSITWLEGVGISLLFAVNLFALFYSFSSTELVSFGRRAAVVSVINMVALFLGGRTNPLMDLLGIPLSTYYVFHHWMGRIVVLGCAIHSILALGRLGSIEKTPLVKSVILSGSLVG